MRLLEGSPPVEGRVAQTEHDEVGSVAIWALLPFYVQLSPRGVCQQTIQTLCSAGCLLDGFWTHAVQETRTGKKGGQTAWLPEQVTPLAVVFKAVEGPPRSEVAVAADAEAAGATQAAEETANAEEAPETKKNRKP